ncbi:hypothetical protein V8G54_004443 [Vigna mungo]|uniref:Uncharacterized protein n=1 Tax=Vigna mungo TaxID=3915 RepID=A0AAQ3SB46_VIGMU
MELSDHLYFEKLAKVGAEMLNPSYGERWNRTVIDDNMLAMFDASETKDPHQDTLDDLFHMLRTGNSLEIIVRSYKLLVDLDKHFPRVYLSQSSSNSPSKLVVAKEAWSPFINCLDNGTAEAGDKESSGPLDPSYGSITSLTGL